MEMLLTNKNTTQKFTIMLQETKDKWRLGRIEMKETLVKIAAEQLSQLSENKDDESIGCPTLFCDELTKAKIAYQELVLKEKAELEKVMEDYVREIVENMAIDTIGIATDALELKIYKDHINTTITDWDYAHIAVDSYAQFAQSSEATHLPIHKFASGHYYNAGLSGEEWRINFKAFIDKKVKREKKLSNTPILIR